QPVGPWDPMDDHVVGRGADHGRKAVVAQEIRRGPALFEDLPRHRVDLERGHAGLGRGPRGLVHLGHHLAGLAHLGQLAFVAPHGTEGRRAWRWASIAPTTRRVTESGEPVPLIWTSLSRSSYHSMSGAVCFS